MDTFGGVDSIWIGRKLMGASLALSERYVELTRSTGEAGAVVGELSEKLLREIGRSLVLGDDNAALPLTRCTGLLRIPNDVEEAMLVRAYNALAALVSSYVCALPGATNQMDRFARDAVRHAARITLQFRRELLRGERRPSTEAHFGGVAVLLYPPRGTQQAAG